MQVFFSNLAKNIFGCTSGIALAPSSQALQEVPRPFKRQIKKGSCTYFMLLIIHNLPRYKQGGMCQPSKA